MLMCGIYVQTFHSSSCGGPNYGDLNELFYVTITVFLFMKFIGLLVQKFDLSMEISKDESRI